MKGDNSFLENASIDKLIFKYSIPAIISGLVSALYNIVDQIFIGQSVGMIGNAATNVAFPLVTICTAVSLLFGIGMSSNFSLHLGKKEEEKAGIFVGNGIISLLIVGLFICIVTLLFLEPILTFCGATPKTLEYSKTYVSITAIGFPFMIFSSGVSHIIRADGSPKVSMFCILSGAILNTILNPIFIFVFDMGIAGAAYATVIGQIVSTVIAVRYIFNFKSVVLNKSLFIPKFSCIKQIMSLGIAPFITHTSITVTQIVMNNVLTHYGAQSIYGSDIPLACVGVITKINMIFTTISVGVAQGTQPVIGYNYGARRYDRVMTAYKKNIFYVSIVSVIAFITFQLFPRQLTALFGSGSEEYFLFAEQYFRIFLFLTFLNGVQPVTGNFFTSIGKAKKGAIVSFTKQLVFLVPLIIILPKFMGIEGVLYAGPIADISAFMLAMSFVYKEFKELKSLQQTMQVNYN